MPTTPKENLPGLSAKLETELSEELLNSTAVILTTGENMFGDKIYAYIRFPMAQFENLRRAMERGEGFKPSDYGEVIEAGRGEPDESTRTKMAQLYGLVTTTRRENQAPPKKAIEPAPDTDFKATKHKNLTLDPKLKSIQEAREIASQLHKSGLRSDTD
jgi:hypothetical protein